MKNVGKGGGCAGLFVGCLMLVALLGGTEASAQTLGKASIVPGLPEPLPEAYAVLPFENRSGSLGLEWMRLAVPFVLAERAEGFARLRPSYGSLVVPRAPKHAPATGLASVAKFASERSVRWVLAGWIRRPDWKLELGVSLYRMDDGKATAVAEHVAVGEFKDVHTMIGEALLSVAATAKLVHPRDDLAWIGRISSTDFYAFTLFGRALGGMLGARTLAEEDKAAHTMQRAVFIEPTFTEAQRLFAEHQRRRFKPLLAKARLEQVVAKRPRYASALVALASSARDHGEQDVALGAMEDVVRIRPWDLEARYELGVMYWEGGDSEKALKQLTMVANELPGHIGARRALVLIHANRSDTANLVSELRAVVSLAPEDIETQLELAAALVSAGTIAEAIDVYKGIVDLDASNVHAHKFLGDLYRQEGRDNRAIRHYGLAIKADPKDPRSYFLLGGMYVEAGQEQEARRIYLRAQRFPRWKGEAYNNLGAIELRRNRVPEAIWYLKRAIQAEGRRASYRYNLALGLSQTHATTEALEQIDTALALQKDNGEYHYLRGVILLRLLRRDDARAAFERALQWQPMHVDAAHNLALLDTMPRDVEAVDRP